jgi:hypothetical protein
MYAVSSTLKVEPLYISETSVSTYKLAGHQNSDYFDRRTNIIIGIKAVSQQEKG